MKKLLFVFIATTFSGSVLAALTGNFKATTNYLWRGKTYSDNQPAIQGGMDYARGGFSMGTWISSSQGYGDGLEADFYGRYSVALGGDFSVHAGGLTFHYPYDGSSTYGRWYGGFAWKNLSLEYARWDYNSTEFRLRFSHGGYDLMALTDEDYFNSGRYTYGRIKRTFELDKNVSLGVRLGYTSWDDENKAKETSHYDYMFSLSQMIDGHTATVFYSDTNRKAYADGKEGLEKRDNSVGFSFGRSW